MKKYLKRMGILAFALLALLALSVSAKAQAPLSDFVYTAQAGEVVLESYKGWATSVIIPAEFSVEGVPCRTVINSKTLFHGNERITSVTIEPGVGFLGNSMRGLFRDCTALTGVDLSGLDTSNITDMSLCFSGCAALSQIEGYESWDTGALEHMYLMFNSTQKLQSVDLSRWDLDQVQNTGWCFQRCAAKTILLPDNLAVISAGFLNHATNYRGSSFTVPAGVKKVGYAHTFYDFGTYSMAQILVAEGNEHYKSVDGILYSADGTELLAVPRVKRFENGIYEIPEGVAFLGELSFSRNYNIKTVVLPNSLELYDVPLKDEAYILFEDTGNLNAGLNLNIAIYCYTGVTAYEVKQDNPRYASLNGIIYNKEMTAVEAVPSRYDKKLVIPEGVRQWKTGAMWCAGDTVLDLMENCPGVEIPASLTDIAPDQLEKLNQLAKRFARFAITVHPENPAYYVEDGLLIARPRLENVLVMPEQTEYVYDGSPKTPAVTVAYEDRTLTEGEDYVLVYRDNTNAGTAAVMILGAGEFFGFAQAEFTIAQAMPEYIVPQDPQAVAGQRLSEITLPEGFSWQEDAVLQSGVHTFLATYDPGDSNYRPITDIPVAVTVEKAPARWPYLKSAVAFLAILGAGLLARSQKKARKL